MLGVAVPTVGFTRAKRRKARSAAPPAFVANSTPSPRKIAPTTTDIFWHP
ncbi:hypothetical protein STXM2123_3792 [Streptomyces sp. F-3]|nr:hypothetical protein STXM2123_3792 [Streptomyces sp. F-3]